MERGASAFLRAVFMSMCSLLILSAALVESVLLRGPSQVEVTDVDQPIVAGSQRSFIPLSDTKFSNSYWQSRQAEYKEAPFKATLSDVNVAKDDDCDNLKTSNYACHKPIPVIKKPAPPAPARPPSPPQPATTPKPPEKKPEPGLDAIENKQTKELRDTVANAQKLAQKQLNDMQKMQSEQATKLINSLPKDMRPEKSNLAAGDLKEALEKAKKAMKDTPTPEQAVKQLLADQKDQ